MVNSLSNTVYPEQNSLDFYGYMLFIYIYKHTHIKNKNAIKHPVENQAQTTNENRVKV